MVCFSPTEGGLQEFLLFFCNLLARSGTGNRGPLGRWMDIWRLGLELFNIQVQMPKGHNYKYELNQYQSVPYDLICMLSEFGVVGWHVNEKGHCPPLWETTTHTAPLTCLLRGLRAPPSSTLSSSLTSSPQRPSIFLGFLAIRRCALSSVLSSSSVSGFLSPGFVVSCC